MMKNINFLLKSTTYQTDKLQVSLLFAYISWKKFCSHSFKAS